MTVPALHRDPTRRRPPEGWQPFRELEDLQERTQQLIEGALTGQLGAEGLRVPLVDIEETEDAWVFEAELPGVKHDDINVEVRDNELTITGQIKERERKGILRRRTRPVGQFEFRVRLPAPANPDAVDASVEDGVLTVRVPKAETARPRRIDVRHG
jgi:HSP20 family protein